MIYCFFIISLVSSATFDVKDPEESLRLLVDEYENNQGSIDSIPKEFIDYFSLPGLVNSLNVQVPEPPKYNRSLVEKKMKNKIFQNPDELADYIKSSFDYPIDRLNAIFYYETNNFLYDMESFLKNTIKVKSYEEIFNKKKVNDKDCSLFMLEMSKKCEIPGLRILQYNSYYKESGSDPSKIPSNPQINHKSISIRYNKQLYISEPSMEGSSILSDNDDASYFMNPVEKTMSSQFPIDNNVLLPISSNYDQFKKLIPYPINNFNFKLESHLFWKYDNYKDSMIFQFSCNPNISNIKYQLKIANDETDYSNYINIETQTNKNRKRIVFHVSFPKKRYLYEFSIWLNNKYMLTYYIQNYANSFKQAPISTLPINDQKFVIIEPQNLMTDVSNNYAILKFISPKRSQCRILKKIGDVWYSSTKNEMATFSSNQDKDMTEKWILIPFYNKGINEIQLLLDMNKKFSHPFTIKSFFFNVGRIKSGSKIPTIDSLLPNNRKPIKIEHDDSIDKPYTDDSFIMSKLFQKKGKDIKSEQSISKGEKLLDDVMKSVNKLTEETDEEKSTFDVIKDFSNFASVMFSVGHELYDEEKDELSDEKFLKLGGEALLGKIKKLTGYTNSEDPKDKKEFKKVVSELSCDMNSYGNSVLDNFGLDDIKEKVKETANEIYKKGKEIYDNFDFETTKELVKDKANEMINKGKEMYDNFDYEQTKENVKNKANEMFNKGKEMYDNFDMDEAKEKMKEKYKQANKYFKSFFGKKKEEEKSDL